MSIAKNQCQLQNLNNIEFVNTKFEDYLKNPEPETRNPKPRQKTVGRGIK
jgi:hypothetical protein